MVRHHFLANVQCCKTMTWYVEKRGGQRRWSLHISYSPRCILQGGQEKYLLQHIRCKRIVAVPLLKIRPGYKESPLTLLYSKASPALRGVPWPNGMTYSRAGLSWGLITHGRVLCTPQKYICRDYYFVGGVGGCWNNCNF